MGCHDSERGADLLTYDTTLTRRVAGGGFSVHCKNYSRFTCKSYKLEGSKWKTITRKRKNTDGTTCVYGGGMLSGAAYWCTLEGTFDVNNSKLDPDDVCDVCATEGRGEVKATMYCDECDRCFCSGSCASKVDDCDSDAHST